MNRTLIYLIMVYFLSGCDLPGKLLISNETNTDISYTIYPKIGQEITDTISLVIPSKKRKGVMFGFGQRWGDRGIENYISTVDKIEIVKNRDTILISGHESLFEHLKKGRRSLLNEKTVIIVE